MEVDKVKDVAEDALEAAVMVAVVVKRGGRVATREALAETLVVARQHYYAHARAVWCVPCEHMV